MKKILSLLALGAVCTGVSAQTDVFTPVQKSDLRAPSVPIIMADPYFQVWSPYNTLNGGTTKHYNGSDKSLVGYVRVDGKFYRFLGQGKSWFDKSKVYVPASEYDTEDQWNADAMIYQGPKSEPSNYGVIVGTPPNDAAGKAWYEAGYALTNDDDNDTWWENRQSPFSSDATYKGKAGTIWANIDETADLYLRRKFTLNKEMSGNVYLACGHDDGPCEYYINGQLVWSIPDNNPDWNNAEVVLLTQDQKNLIKTDGSENILAVHVHQDWGGAFADCGIYGEKTDAEVALVPMADAGAWNAKYSLENLTEDPGFASIDYDGETDMQDGKGAFGDEGQAYRHTDWSGDNTDITIRRHFTLTKVPDPTKTYIVKFRHDDAFMLWLNGDGNEIYDNAKIKAANGTVIIRRGNNSGGTDCNKEWIDGMPADIHAIVPYTGNTWTDGTQYITRVLTAEQVALLHQGDNVLTAYAHNNRGGSNADFGIYELDVYNHPTDIATQNSVNITATQSYFNFTAGPVDLDVVFTSPQVITDQIALSTPINYVSYRTKANDGNAHSVQVYLETTPQIAVGNDANQNITSLVTANGLTFVKTGTTVQQIHRADRQNWGYLYIAADPAKNQTIGFGNYKLSSNNMMATGNVPTVADGTTYQSEGGTDEMPMILFKQDLGSSTEASGFTMLGFDDEGKAIKNVAAKATTDNEGNPVAEKTEILPGFWSTKYSSLTVAMADYAANYDANINAARTMDNTVYTDAKTAGGTKYAELCALAYRQVVAGNKLVLNTDGKALNYTTAITSGNDIQTIDAVFPEAPLFLAYNPDLAVATLKPYFKWMNERGWTRTDVPNDLGVGYPIVDNFPNIDEATGTMIGYPNQTECTANFVLEAGMAAKLGATDKPFFSDNYDRFKAFTDYLAEIVTPAKEDVFKLEGTADSFNCRIVNNSHLSAKAILAVAAFGEIAKAAGHEDEAATYLQKAKDLAANWKANYLADTGDHYIQGYFNDGNAIKWGQKYDLAYDRMLGSGLFTDVINTEVAYYLTLIPNFKYGMPMDARYDGSVPEYGYRAKLDENVIAATLTNNDADFAKLVDPCWNYVNETPNHFALRDYYNPKTAGGYEFQARPVVGMFWAPVVAKKTTTAIDNAIVDRTTAEDTTGNVYSIDGRIVAKGVKNLNNLKKGVYIFKGKKFVVK